VSLWGSAPNREFLGHCPKPRQENFFQKVFLDLSKTLNGRKTNRKFALQIICVFGGV